MLRKSKKDSTRGNVGGKCNILPFNNSVWAKTNAILNHSRFGIGGAAFRVSKEAHNTDSVPFGAFLGNHRENRRYARRLAKG